MLLLRPETTTICTLVIIQLDVFFRVVFALHAFSYEISQFHVMCYCARRNISSTLFSYLFSFSSCLFAQGRVCGAMKMKEKKSKMNAQEFFFVSLHEDKRSRGYGRGTRWNVKI